MRSLIRIAVHNAAVTERMDAFPDTNRGSQLIDTLLCDGMEVKIPALSRRGRETRTGQPN
jgi:hypothetical protein